MEAKLTKLQAYNAMVKFLDIYYDQNKSDDIGSLLSVMQFLIDGDTADPAIWEDWLESVSSVTNTEEKITKLEAYKAMIKFLNIYYDFTKSQDVGSLLGDMRIHTDDDSIDSNVWNNWIKCINDTLKEPADKKNLLTFM